MGIKEIRMVRGAPKQQSNTSLMYFFAALGLLLLISTMVPSCHSRHEETGPWNPKRLVKGHGYHASPTPPPSRASQSHTSPTPPAKPLTPPTPPPPHH